LLTQQSTNAATEIVVVCHSKKHLKMALQSQENGGFAFQSQGATYHMGPKQQLNSLAGNFAFATVTGQEPALSSLDDDSEVQHLLTPHPNTPTVPTNVPTPEDDNVPGKDATEAEEPAPAPDRGGSM
jgi:hypothetical protein